MTKYREILRLTALEIRCLTPLNFINGLICIDEFNGLCYCYS